MGLPAALGGAIGGMQALSSIMGDAQGNRQLELQRRQAEQQAQAAKIRGQIDQQNIDRERHKLSAGYREMQGKNLVSTAAGNIDASTGSAMRVADGNANMYSADLVTNQEQRDVRGWQTENEVNQANWQADYFQSAKKSFGETLLGTGLSGLSGFLSGYSMAGGKLFTEDKEWETLWDKGKGEKLLEMRHPSGKVAKI